MVGAQTKEEHKTEEIDLFIVRFALGFGPCGCHSGVRAWLRPAKRESFALRSLACMIKIPIFVYCEVGCGVGRR